MRTLTLQGHCFLVAAAWFLSGAAMAGDNTNTTGLPTYPHEDRPIMDKQERGIPNGQHCSHYMSSSTDPLAKVIDWYRKALPQARSQDVNIDSMYGAIALEGVKFTVGNDFATIYRVKSLPAGEQTTAIELFKCRDAPAPKAH